MAIIAEQIKSIPQEYTAPSRGTHDVGYTMAREIFSKLRVLPEGWQPGAAIHEIKEERRGRRKEIQNLQEKIREIPLTDRGLITEELNFLQAQQFATRLVIRHFEKVRHFERGGVK